MSLPGTKAGVQCVSKLLRLRAGLKVMQYRSFSSSSNKPKDWSAVQYLKFGNERTRAVYDLIARVPLTSPKRVVDIGCGPGNSTAVLKERYPDANLAGMDSSENMIAKARADLPDVDFTVGDLRTHNFEGSEPVDLYFSNAVYHWIPHGDRLSLLARIFSTQSSGGVFAFQVPDNFYEPCHIAMRDLAAEPPFAAFQNNAGNPLLDRFPRPEEIYNALKPLSSSIDIWRTYYQHILEDHKAIVEWVKGTGLQPYINPLSEEHKQDYLQKYLARLERSYKKLDDGKVMLAYPRMFVVAVRK